MGYGSEMHAWILLATAFAGDLPFSTQGCDQLLQLSELRFTFHVEASGELKLTRAWVYHPRTGQVTRTLDGESMTFIFGSPQSEKETEADAHFLNDSYWLFPMCHIAWSIEATTIADPVQATLPVAPVGEAPGRGPMVSVQYDPDAGGYTPGDAFDLYLGDQGEIVAWSYRRKGKHPPMLSTTFTDYVQAGPVRVATEHRSADREFRLFFTDIVATP